MDPSDVENLSGRSFRDLAFRLINRPPILARIEATVNADIIKNGSFYSFIAIK